MSEHELKHYGVIGMMWGVRKDPAKAYERASKKLSKLDAKVSKREEKALRRRDRYDRLKLSRFATRAKLNKARRNSLRASVKLNRQVVKAQKWYNAMDKTFKKTDISLTNEQVAMGKRYANMRSIRAMTI